MTSSDRSRGGSEEILDRLAALLDEDLLAHRIDEPIDRALAAFRCDADFARSPAHFHTVIGGFVQDAHRRLLARRTPALQARDEAVALLDQAYRGTYADGYCGALLDATDLSQAGLRSVLAKLAELLKNERRRIYMTWIRARVIDPRDWRAKCALAAAAIARYRPWLPPEIARAPAGQWADHVVDLVLLDSGTDRQLARSLDNS